MRIRIDTAPRPITEQNIEEIRTKLQAAIDKELRAAAMKHQALTALSSISHYKQINAKVEAHIKANCPDITHAYLTHQYGDTRLRLGDSQWGDNQAEWTIYIKQGSTVQQLITKMKEDFATEQYIRDMQAQFDYLPILLNTEERLRELFKQYEECRVVVSQQILAKPDGYWHPTLRPYLTALTAQG